MTRIALDSNILVYLAGICRSEGDEPKIDQVRDLIRNLSATVDLVAPAQTLGELFVVMRRSGASPEEARAVLVEFGETFATPASEGRTTTSAADLVVDHRLRYWDALIVTASADAGCALLLSEDMHHGFVTRGMMIVNPFTMPLHPKLSALIAENERQ